MVRLFLYFTQARLKILSKSPSSSSDRSPDVQAQAQALALTALGWVLTDQNRAERFLGLTGLSPDELRASLSEPATMGAVLDFLCGHEPDLLAAADALEVSPQTLVMARERLGS